MTLDQLKAAYRDALVATGTKDPDYEVGMMVVTVSCSSRMHPFRPGGLLKRVMRKAGIKGTTELRHIVKRGLNQY